MSSMDEQILRASKEIIVKFIETGRVSPSGFSEAFKSIYDTVAAAVKGLPEEANDSTETGKT